MPSTLTFPSSLWVRDVLTHGFVSFHLPVRCVGASLLFLTLCTKQTTLSSWLQGAWLSQGPQKMAAEQHRLWHM